MHDICIYKNMVWDIYIYIYIQIYIYIYIYIHIYIYIYIYNIIYIYVCVRLHIDVSCMSVYRQCRVHAKHIYNCIFNFTHVCMIMYTCTNI